MVVQRLYLFASWGEVLMPSKSLRNSLCGNQRFVKFALVLAALFVMVLTSGPAYPQGDTGRILGVVTDQSGGYVANAKDDYGRGQRRLGNPDGGFRRRVRGDQSSPRNLYCSRRIQRI